MTIKAETITRKKIPTKTLINKCHICGKIEESYCEIQKCRNCQKSFLPHNYFGKIHATNSHDFYELFEPAENLNDEDLIKGLFVLW